MSRRVIVVGGGAAGMMAALAARRGAADVILVERNKRLGVKILISGGGRCNITHDGSPREIEQGFVPREGRFLRYSLHEFPPSAVLAMLHEQGVETLVRPNGRVFPASGRAEDVLSAFERILSVHRIEVVTSTRVDSLVIDCCEVTGVRCNDKTMVADSVVIATGGLSYRKVGTTGDGIRWGVEAGLRAEPARAALAPIYFTTPPPADWQGVSLRGVEVSVRFRSRIDGSRPGDAASGSPSILTPPDGVPTSWRDDLLLTHRGLSGPSILEISRSVAWGIDMGARPVILIDIVPDLTRDELRKRFDERRSDSPATEVQTMVSEYMPRALVPWFLRMLGIDAGVRLADLTRIARTVLLDGLKGWMPGEVGEVPIDKGEVTAGGIALDQIDPRTMRARGLGGLYIAGEALDIAGSIGGYNLQAAFSTGWVAGRSAALGQDNMKDA